MCGNIDNTYSYELVVAERFRQWNHYGHEDYGLLTHAENGPEKAEQKHQQHDHDVSHTQFPDQREPFKTAGHPDELHDSFIHGLCAVHHPESATDYQHEGNDSSLLAEALEQCGKHLPGLRHSSRHKPCCNSCQQNGTEDYHICIGNANFHMIFFSHAKLQKNRQTQAAPKSAEKYCLVFMQFCEYRSLRVTYSALIPKRITRVAPDTVANETVVS